MRCCLLAVAAWLTFLNSLPAVEFELKDVRVALYTEIVTLDGFTSLSPGGIVLEYEPPRGALLCGVAYQLEITWGTDYAFQLPAKEVGIEGGISIGSVDEYGGLRIQKAVDGRSTVSIGRVRESKANLYYGHHLFLLPPGTKEVTFQFGTKTHKLKLGKPVKFDPTTSCKIAVHPEIARLKSLDLKTPANAGKEVKLVSPLVNPGGDILAVQVTLQPQAVGAEAVAANKIGIALDRFFLSFGKGGRAICIGCLDQEEFVARGPSFEPGDEPKLTTFYFAVPATVNTFELNYMGHPVGKFTVEVLP